MGFCVFACPVFVDSGRRRTVALPGSGVFTGMSVTAAGFAIFSDYRQAEVVHHACAPVTVLMVRVFPQADYGPAMRAGNFWQVALLPLKAWGFIFLGLT